MKRIQNIVGLLGSLALAVLPLWVDSTVPLAARIAGSVSTAIALVFSAAKLKQYAHAILGGLAVGGMVVAIVVGKLQAGTTGAVIGGTLLAVLTNLRAIFARDLGAVPTDNAVPGMKDPDATPTAVNPTGGQPKK
jgi:hypothetical protein